MKSTACIIVVHLTRLNNGGIKSVSKAEIFSYLLSIGFKRKSIEEGLKNAINNKDVIPLKNGKVTLNLTKK